MVESASLLGAIVALSWLVGWVAQGVELEWKAASLVSAAVCATLLCGGSTSGGCRLSPGRSLKGAAVLARTLAAAIDSHDPTFKEGVWA